MHWPPRDIHTGQPVHTRSLSSGTATAHRPGEESIGGEPKVEGAGAAVEELVEAMVVVVAGLLKSPDCELLMIVLLDLEVLVRF